MTLECDLCLEGDFYALIINFLIVIHISSWSGVEASLRFVGSYKKKRTFCVNM